MEKAFTGNYFQDYPSTETPLNATTLNKMVDAIDEIDNRVISLAGYSESAKQSEELAKEYMEKAMAGTPEGYAELVEDVSALSEEIAGGTVGQFAVSDGNGGITWQTVVDGNEVAY